jgi:hypothetical protein
MQLRFDMLMTPLVGSTFWSSRVANMAVRSMSQCRKSVVIVNARKQIDAGEFAGSIHFVAELNLSLRSNVLLL